MIRRIDDNVPMRRLMVAFLVSLLVAGCKRQVHGLAGSTWTSFGRARMITWNVTHLPTGRVVPLVHILFVPDWDSVPRGDQGSANSDSGTIDRMEIRCTFYDGSRKVAAQPFEIHNAETVHAAGRSWNLRNGNVFVAIVNPDGTLRITQLSTNESSPAGVLAFIKRSLSAEPRVQELKAER